MRINGAAWHQWAAERSGRQWSGFSRRDLGHLDGQLLSLGAQESSERNDTQTRGCFAKRYLQRLVLLGKSEKSFRLLWQPRLRLFSMIPTLAHQTSAERSWRLWQSPALHEHVFESYGRKPSPSPCGVILPSAGAMQKEMETAGRKWDEKQIVRRMVMG